MSDHLVTSGWIIEELNGVTCELFSIKSSVKVGVTECTYF